MFRKKGLIAKIKDNYCIIVTTEGTYKKIPVPAGGARPGMEITYRSFDFYPLLKPVMLAASVLILLIGLTLFRQAAVPPAVAYVSLDINPSLEMAVNEELQVVNVDFFNDDGVNLVQKTELEGKNLYEALKILVQKAIEQKYIKPDQKNLMISTIAATAADTTDLNPAKLQQALEGAITSGGFTGEVRVYAVDEKVRTEAQQTGLSPGKFIIYEQLKETGAKVTVDEVKENSIRKLVDIYRIKLLPNNKKIIIQKLDNNGQPRVLIEETDSPAVAPDKDEDDVDADTGKKHKENEDDDDDKNEKTGAPQIKIDEKQRKENINNEPTDEEDNDKKPEQNKEKNQDKNKGEDRSTDSGDVNRPESGQNDRDHAEESSNRDSTGGDSEQDSKDNDAKDD